jgi:hypothetical protein
MSKYPKSIRSGNSVVTLYYYPKDSYFKIAYYKEPNDGKETRVFQSGRGSEDEAHDEAKKLVHKLGRPAAAAALAQIPPPIPLFPGPAKPLLVKDLVDLFLELKKHYTEIAKAGGGIVPERLRALKFAGRFLTHRYGNRLIHTITAAELRELHAACCLGKVDFTPIHLPGSRHRLRKGQKPSPVTVTTLFQRCNSFFVFARESGALFPGPTAAWIAQSTADPDGKTSQLPYTSDELKKVLPFLEEKAPQLVCGVVFLLEGGRICELVTRIKGTTTYLFLNMAHVHFGEALDENGHRFAIPTGSIEVPAALAKSGRRAGKGRWIHLSAFGHCYFWKYRKVTEVFVPLRWRKQNGKWVKAPINFGKALANFIKKHKDEIGLDSFRRGGFRHLGASTRPHWEGAQRAAKSQGHSLKISREFYDARIAPLEAGTVLNIMPLKGPPKPFPPLYGAEKMRRDQAPRRRARGKRVPLCDSAPLLMEFRDFYVRTCGTKHGWQMRLAELLKCSSPCITRWWQSCSGSSETEVAPVARYVEQLQRLLADKESLALKVDRRKALLSSTVSRIDTIRPYYETLHLDCSFEYWLASQMPPVLTQIAKDWIRGRRAASPHHLNGLDNLIGRLQMLSATPSLAHGTDPVIKATGSEPSPTAGIA